MGWVRLKGDHSGASGPTSLLKQGHPRALVTRLCLDTYLAY